MRILNRFNGPAFTLVGVMLALGQAVPAHAASDQERSAARDLARRGAQAYDAGKYEEALDLCARASEIVQVPSILIYVARSSAKLGKLIRAREAYNAILRQPIAADAPAAFQEAHKDAELELPAVEARMARVTVTVSGTEAKEFKVLIDGTEMNRALINVPQPLDPGEHRFEVVGDGLESTPVSKAVAEGVSDTVTVKVHAVGAPAPAVGSAPAADAGVKSGGRHPTLAYVALGVGVVGLGVGTFMGIRYFSKNGQGNDRFNECNPRRCTPDEKSQIASLDHAASTAGIVSVASLAVGAAAGVVGVYLLVSAPKDQAAPTVGLGFLPGGASVAGRF